MRDRTARNYATAALALSLLALIASNTGLASAARHAIARMVAGHPVVAGHPLSAKPRPGGILLLGRNRRFPASAIPTVQNATHIAGKTLGALTSCPGGTVDLGSWCLETVPYPVSPAQKPLANYFWASQTCVAAGGYLPTAAQLIGAAKKVRLDSTITDNPSTSTIAEEPEHSGTGPAPPGFGLKDQREMSATLVTTVAGSDAAGSEGVSVGSTGNPRSGEPNPTPQPANPQPATLQYVTVYSNGTKGGFAGSEPVAHAENFRCAFNKVAVPPPAVNQR